MNQENKRKRKLLSALGLIVTTIIWGSSFVVMKNSIAVLPPTYLLALRFTLAFTGLYLVFLKRMKKAGKTDWICGGILGVFLFAAYWFQTYGLKYTTASKNAFITTLYVILVPFLHWFFNKKKPGVHNMAAAVIAVFGLALLSLEGDLTISLGDLLTLVSGLFFAFHIVFIDRYSARYDPVRLTVIQIGAAALLGWITAPCLEGALDFGVLTPSIGAGLLYLSIFSTMICILKRESVLVT